MNKIKNLHVKRLLRELEYIESDFEYRSEVISEVDSNFINTVNDFLIHHPEIKEVYDIKVNEKIDKSINKKIEDLQNESISELEPDKEYNDESDEESKDTNEEKEDIIDIKHEKVKKTYREIVKITHPDVIQKKKLNDLYIVATKYYDQEDQIGLYKVCDELDIYYEIDDSDEESISNKIVNLKTRIEFLEKTFTWKWHNSKDEIEKNQIIINYIKLRIS